MPADTTTDTLAQVRAALAQIVACDGPISGGPGPLYRTGMRAGFKHTANIAKEALSLLEAPASPVVGDREAIARVLCCDASRPHGVCPTPERCEAKDWLPDADAILALFPTRPQPGEGVCQTCNGRGEIGWFEHGIAPGYVTERCPDCPATAVPEREEHSARAVLSADCWLPIDSAPKDGTEVDLWVSVGVRIANCRWGKPAAANWGDRYGDDRDLPEGWMTRSGHALDRRNGEPTHWMSHPPAPGTAPTWPPAGTPVDVDDPDWITKSAGDQWADTPEKVAGLLALLRDPMDACLRWKGFAANTIEQLANRGAARAEEEPCMACREPMQEGDPFYVEVNTGSPIHAACCGPEREGYVVNDEPLKPGEPIPTPAIWSSQNG